jgi:predicted nucleic-acid-binding protein
MIGIDTNVLLRYILQDDPKQAAVASEIMDALTEQSPGYLNHVVLCETAWVLQRGYDYDKASVTRVLNHVVNTRELQLEQRDVVISALSQYNHNTADWADSLIGEKNRHSGAETTITFDRRASRLTTFQHLP